MQYFITPDVVVMAACVFMGADAIAPGLQHIAQMAVVVDDAALAVDAALQQAIAQKPARGLMCWG